METQTRSIDGTPHREKSMSDDLPARETALALLEEYTQKPGLIKHVRVV